MTHDVDVAVIGAGPAGLAAAQAAQDAGARTALVEREDRLGGVLKQCIHDGFGLMRYGERLTGPEYAWRDEVRLRRNPPRLFMQTFVHAIAALPAPSGGFRLTLVNPRDGVFDLTSATLVAATGCRERTDRQIFVHGDRPAGVFTAGQAQDYINLRGYLPGRRCVVVGSGDVGLIMARRLTWEGAEVPAVYEIGPEPSGLTRNVAQCLEDYGIPLHLNSTVTEIRGRDRVEGVTVCPVDRASQPIRSRAETVACDAVILSVGLIPENDMLRGLGVEMDPATGGPTADRWGETSVPGLFSCGNALQVSDLVDDVSSEGAVAGNRAARRAARLFAERRDGTAAVGPTILRRRIRPRGNLRTLVPQVIGGAGIDDAGPATFSFRPRRSATTATVKLIQGHRVLDEARCTWLKPAEMVRLNLNLSSYDPSGPEPEFLVSEAGGPG